MDTLFCCLIALFLGLAEGVKTQNHYVIAPKTLRLNTDETIGIAVDGNGGGPVLIYVQDYPGKVKNITKLLLNVYRGVPELFKIHLDPERFPPGFLSGPGYPKLVSLNAKFQTYYQELLIPISNQSGYVFIQTDKPIYTPKERVSYRIIPLSEDVLPSNKELQLQIRNPQNIVVEKKNFNARDKKHGSAFVTDVYTFPKYPVLGEWSASVLYGHGLKQNSTVHFQLQEYVLPTFTVKLKTPDVILPTDEIINIRVYAKYVYGKNVNGAVSFRLGVKKNPDTAPIFFAVASRKLEDGFYELKVHTVNLKANDKIGWFPGIRTSRLVVEADVIDAATGNKEEAVDSSTFFFETPFIISFERCLRDFKPGHTSVFEADISYGNGQPAVAVSTRIRAVADNGQPVVVLQNHTKSNEEGRVSFQVRPEIHHRNIYITLRTDDPRYGGLQAEKTFKQQAFLYENNSYIALVRNSPQRLKPGDKFQKTIFFQPAGLRNIYYLVISRGKILKLKKLPDGKYNEQNLEFDITYDMVPSFRVLIFTHHEDQLLVDSLKIDVMNECSPSAEVQIDPQYSIKEPGHNGKIIIRGTKGTYVGVIGVDEAVYALSKTDLLTKVKVFERLASHDLGCGPGGGLTVADVLAKAGISLGTNAFLPSPSYSCEERKRKKREIFMDIEDLYSGFERLCCTLGLEQDIYHRSCEERAGIVEQYIKEVEYVNCTAVFKQCCTYIERNRVNDLLEQKVYRLSVGKSFEDDIELMEIDSELEDSFESRNVIRSLFKETWLFQDTVIGPDNQEEIGASLPHSITTWVIQAVSVSPHGICVAEPQKLVSFQKIFLHLNLPYSVVRNEQIEIQATVFNYDDKRIKAVVYMYGAEALCSGTEPGEKSDRKNIFIDGNSAATVTFPVIPLKAGVIPVKVVALTAVGSDVIQRSLNVVPEGVTKEINIPITLDPTNLQKRQKRSLDTPLVTDHIDPGKKKQVTTVKLCLPENFVPGTESCSITAIGDILGPAVETTVNNPDSLITLPDGCGEQNMKNLAPTLYTMRYLKVTGKLTADAEEKGYKYMRIGYANQLNKGRREDGSYAAFTSRPANTWLTAFVTKVFCQSSELIYIDDNVLCSAIRWLINHQEADGSYLEHHPLYAREMMTGMEGKVPLTAFVLIALEECKCDEMNLLMAKARAVAYLERNLAKVTHPLPTAIVAYALTLSNSELAFVANDRLLRLAKYEPGPNMMYWNTNNSAHAIQTAGYALLTELLLNDMQSSTSIVNWLNKKQLKTGAYVSTQDTVIALQAMSEYAIKAQMPPINMVVGLSSSNDRYFLRNITLNDDNAQVLQDVKVDKVGGTIFLNTAGQGKGSLSVNLRYNVVVPPDDICKFDIIVNVTDTKQEDLITGLREELNSGIIKMHSPSEDSRKLKYRISLCVRYLGDKDAEMSIVDVGIFSGFAPVIEDLQMIESDLSEVIQKYELTKRGVIFYLEKIPASDKFCFFFHVVRQYIVGNTQMSSIKVYDYYNPGTTCTAFYKPISNSPIIRTICDDGICQCAEGGCPPKTPFSDLYQKNDNSHQKRRESLKTKLCDDFDYVWKGRLDTIRVEGGFFNISFIITEIIKAGIERPELIEGETRTLLARDNCPSAMLNHDSNYLIMGKDGQSYLRENGDLWYRYLLDQTSVIHKWTTIAKAENQHLQRDFVYVTGKLKTLGCDK